MSAVRNWLKKHRLVINKKKCIFVVEEVEHLGHQVPAQGIKPLPNWVKAITTFPLPSTG